MNFRRAKDTDLTVIKEILSSERLPVEDCEDHISNFMVAEQDENIIATGGLEICGNTGLLRSISVKNRYRNQGIAKNIIDSLIIMAKDLGLKELYLFTESASAYFEKQGFSKVERDVLPEVVKATKQCSTLCPDSAIVLNRII